MDKDTVLVNVHNSVFGWFDAVSLIAGIASLLLAILAIWLSLHFKRDSDAINMQTKELLIEVRSESKHLSEVIMPELKAYGSSMRNIATGVTFSSKTENFQISDNNLMENDVKEKTT